MLHRRDVDDAKRATKRIRPQVDDRVLFVVRHAVQIRQGAGCGGPRTHRPHIISSPALQLVRVEHRAKVFLPRRQFQRPFPVAEVQKRQRVAHLPRRVPDVRFVDQRVGTATELSVIVTPPALHAAVVERRADGLGGARQRDDSKRRAVLVSAQINSSRRTTDLVVRCRVRRVTVRPQPELTVEVLAPTPRVAFARRRAPEIGTLTTVDDFRGVAAAIQHGDAPVDPVRSQLGHIVRFASSCDRAPNPEHMILVSAPAR
mmetsp:Transcript_14694/g.63057  ORF Transcript_14694/g.63057 Transcript_14694/m.63057 type:complete len:259 (+) Transcript_14694:2610-3386(+)